MFVVHFILIFLVSTLYDDLFVLLLYNFFNITVVKCWKKSILNEAEIELNLKIYCSLNFLKWIFGMQNFYENIPSISHNRCAKGRDRAVSRNGRAVSLIETATLSHWCNDLHFLISD